MRFSASLLSLVLSLSLTACGLTTTNLPIDLPLTSFDSSSPYKHSVFADIKADRNDDTLVFLSFSGGGSRATAFANGVLNALADHQISVDGQQFSLLEKVKFVSGVSGGAIMAAYFGLHGEEAVRTMRERFLSQDVESILRISPYNVFSIARLLLGGGVNDPAVFAQWLDRNLFFDATMGDLLEGRRGKGPAILIQASDVYNAVPFLFIPLVFNSMCADLYSYPVSYAVAASSSVPPVFLPLTLESHASSCPRSNVDLIESLLKKSGKFSENLDAFFQTLNRYANGDVSFIKLLDGGLTDNLGLSGLLLARFAGDAESNKKPAHLREPTIRPLTPETAVKLKKLLFFAVDSHIAERAGDEAVLLRKTLSNPHATALSGTILNTFIESNSRNIFDLLRILLDDWERDIVRYRCSLPASEVLKIRGTLKGWDCGNIDIQLSSLDFSDLPEDRRKVVDSIPTRFNILKFQVDSAIEAGYYALMNDPLFGELGATPIIQEEAHAVETSPAGDAQDVQQAPQ